MAFAIQGFLQTPPPVIDQTLTPFNAPTTTVGNASATSSLTPPQGILSGATAWINTGGALATDVDADNGGGSFRLTCTPGTLNGIGPGYGIVGRVLAPVAGTLVLPYPINVQMVRVEVFGLHFATAPAGTQCGQDAGIVFSNGGIGNGSITDSLHTAGQGVGFGLVYDTTNAQLRFVAKQLSGNTNPLSINQDVGNPANGITNPFYVDFRWIAPTVATAASLQLFIDNAQVALTAAQSSWAPGTLLPTPGVGANQVGWLPVVSNNTGTALTANPLLRFAGVRVRIGSIAACTLENQK